MDGHDRIGTDLKTGYKQVLYPPITDRRFWVIQLILAMSFLFHLVADNLQDKGAISAPGFVWILLLFIPLLYAGTSFGFVGSLAVAGEGVILDIPMEILQKHTSMELWGAWSCLAMLMIAGIVLGFRFEAERTRFADILSTDRSKTTEYYTSHPLFGEHLLDLLPDGVALIDGNGDLGYVNHTLESISGYTNGELTGREIDLLFPHNPEFTDASRRSLSSDSLVMPAAKLDNLQLITRSETRTDVSLAISHYYLDGETFTIAVIRDDTDRKSAERLKEEYEQRFHLAFENNVAGMVITDPSDRIVLANDAFCSMIGVEKAEIVGKTTEGVTFRDDKHITREMGQKLLRGELAQAIYTKRYQQKNGDIVWAEISRSLARSAKGEPRYFVVSVRDITQEHSLLSQLSHQAMHDPLTGLANRVLFQQVLARALANVRRSGRWVTVIFIDLDDFKEVNDTFGHSVGDDLLVAVAQRLTEATRTGDLLGRFGGDEFVYLGEGLKSPQEAELLAQRLLEVFDAPFTLSEGSLLQSASIGIAVSSETGENVDILRDADVALYQSKRAGKSRTSSFNSEMRERISNRVELAKDLQVASETNQLFLNYQPILNLVTGQVIGAEALLRWNHPKHGLIMPDVFIPIAERSRLIFDLATMSLKHALEQVGSWDRPLHPKHPPFITVNLSSRQFHDGNLLNTLQNILIETNVEPRRLALEITESTALTDIDSTKATLEMLKNLGVMIAIDGFGTGYSSLSYLALFQPDILKVDRSFVASAQGNPADHRMLEAIVTLGTKMDATVIAEGIEKNRQLEMLRRLGYLYGQGYLFSPAISAPELSKISTLHSG